MSKSVVHRYSHDYENDTTIEYVVNGERTELRLSFEHEDEDCGIERIIYSERITYGGDLGESMGRLVSCLLADITDYLDAQENHDAEFDDASMAVDFDDLTRTALYAFENALKAEWRPAKDDEWRLGYSDVKAPHEQKCIGHLRGDFGRSGTEFWTSWFDHNAALKTADFRNRLQDVVNELREDGGMLHDFSTMRKLCRDGFAKNDCYFFCKDDRQYSYALRCIPRIGDYHFYLYCYMN